MDSTLITFLIMGVFASLVIWKPSWFIHPVMTWHRVVLGHKQKIVHTGFADLDLSCSCGKYVEL